MDRRVLSALLLAVSVAPFAAPGAAWAATRYAFVTSVSGTGDLHSWPDAGGASGLAAGDAICQARAAAGGLANPGLYVAWMSTSTTDAYCHLHHLTGKVTTNCGQGTLPAAAGPWVRTDGRAWGADVTHLLDPFDQVYLPPRYDENGALVVEGHAWTGTAPDGTVASDTCIGWTSTSGSDYAIAGSTEHTARGWGDFYLDRCSAQGRLICLERLVGDSLPTFSNWGHFVFVTSAQGNGDLSSWPQAGGQVGLGAGDAICRNLAAAAGLANSASYKAWLSTGSVDARDRIVNDGPWMRLDRVRLSPDFAGLTDGRLNTSPNLTETGVYVANSAVWTGTLADGTAASDRCNSWTSASASANGDAGAANAANASWTDYDPVDCDFGSGRIYCLEDVPLVFRDGFESDDTDTWSAVSP